MSPNPNQNQSPSSVSIGPGSGVTESYSDGAKCWTPKGLSVAGETRSYVIEHSTGALFQTNLSDDVFEESWRPRGWSIVERGELS
jgi:hypothetical protein